MIQKKRIQMINENDFTLVDEYSGAEVAVQRFVYITIINLTKWTGYWLIPFLVVGGLS